MPLRLAGQPDSETPDADAAGKTDVFVIKVVGTEATGVGFTSAGVSAVWVVKVELASLD